MKVAGFTFIRNAIINDYPIREAILSILPICDEFVIAVGKSDDDTLSMVAGLNSPKIRIIETVWDETLREGGAVFASETDKAFDAISKDADWAFYIQGDECVHENDLPLIKKEMELTLHDNKIEGLLFNYRHFYGSYNFIAESRKWYRREIRIVRRSLNVRSYKDAQGFRIDNRKIKVKLIKAFINHYGWVKHPNSLVKKGMNFSLFYDKNAVANEVPTDAAFDYGNADKLVPFNDAHPLVIQERIDRQNWSFDGNIKELKSTRSMRQRILQRLFELTGLRVGEYKNYTIVSR